MKSNDILQEASAEEVTYTFWVDNLGNLLMDINDKEELKDYINKRAGLLNRQFKEQLRGSDIKNLSIPEIVNRINWFYIKLFGFKSIFSLYDLDNKKRLPKLEKKEREGIIYTKMHITTDLRFDPKKNLKNKIIDRIISSVKAIHPSIERIKVFGANDNSTEYYL